MTYQEAESYINDTPKFTKKNTLENTRMVLDAMGHPERKMKLIHVAGSNGKGSVCAYLSSILKAAGKEVGLFTSPHLVKINERFKINGEMISDERFVNKFQGYASGGEETTRRRSFVVGCVSSSVAPQRAICCPGLPPP